MIRGMAAAFEDELREADLDVAQLLTGASAHLSSLEAQSGLVFDRWASHLNR